MGYHILFHNGMVAAARFFFLVKFNFDYFIYISAFDVNIRKEYLLSTLRLLFSFADIKMRFPNYFFIRSESIWFLLLFDIEFGSFLLF